MIRITAELDKIIFNTEKKQNSLEHWILNLMYYIKNRNDQRKKLKIK